MTRRPTIVPVVPYCCGEYTMRTLAYEQAPLRRAFIQRSNKAGNTYTYSPTMTPAGKQETFPGYQRGQGEARSARGTQPRGPIPVCRWMWSTVRAAMQTLRASSRLVLCTAGMRMRVISQRTTSIVVLPCGMRSGTPCLASADMPSSSRRERRTGTPYPCGQPPSCLRQKTRISALS